jgi:hypothetical protein
LIVVAAKSSPQTTQRYLVRVPPVPSIASSAAAPVALAADCSSVAVARVF